MKTIPPIAMAGAVASYYGMSKAEMIRNHVAENLRFPCRGEGNRARKRRVRLFIFRSLA